MTIINYESLTGEPMVAMENEDGSVTSMLKSTYDEMIAAQENFTPIL